MGTFGSYRGRMHIAEDKKEEFTARILKLLNYGGMMQFDKVCMYGKEIILIKPVEADQDGKAYFHYNYFEDDAWESAGYNTQSTYFFSGKIGGREFCDVVTAVHFLYELYDDGIGYVDINGEIVEGSPYVGWINHILGTDFSLKKRFRLWDQFEGHCLGELDEDEEYSDEEYDDAAKRFDMRDLVPYALHWALGGVEFSDIYYILKGTESLQKEELVPDSYPEAVYRCKILLEQYFCNSTIEESEQIRKVWQLVKSERKVREEMLQQDIYDIAQMSLKLPARVIVYLTCEMKGKSFWPVWKELRDAAYRDETMPQYAPDDLITKRIAAIEKPIERVTTAEFLRQDGSFAFWDTPEELKGKANYYISDDDRIFWWDESEEVILSEKMHEWLSNLAERHRQLLKEIACENQDKEDFLRELISVLADIDNYYKRVFSFQSMFYDFLQNGTDRRYIAAVELLKELAKENQEEGKIIEKVKCWWDITSKNVTHNAGRIAMKRYLSVMANRKLREKYFGF